MRAGQLDREITIQRVTTHQDRSRSWSDHAAGVPARVIERDGRELLAAGSAEVSLADALFVIRYREDLRTADRIVYQSRNYDIRSIREMSELGRRRALQIAAKAAS